MINQLVEIVYAYLHEIVFIVILDFFVIHIIDIFYHKQVYKTDVTVPHSYLFCLYLFDLNMFAYLHYKNYCC